MFLCNTASAPRLDNPGRLSAVGTSCIGDYNVPNIIKYKRTHNRPYMTSLLQVLNFSLSSRSALPWAQSRRVWSSVGLCRAAVDRSCDCLADFLERLGSLIINSGE